MHNKIKRFNYRDTEKVKAYIADMSEWDKLIAENVRTKLGHEKNIHTYIPLAFEPYVNDFYRWLFDMAGYMYDYEITELVLKEIFAYMHNKNNCYLILGYFMGDEEYYPNDAQSMGISNECYRIFDRYADKTEIIDTMLRFNNCYAFIGALADFGTNKVDNLSIGNHLKNKILPIVKCIIAAFDADGYICFDY